jgi:hypothetical protein
MTKGRSTSVKFRFRFDMRVRHKIRVKGKIKGGSGRLKTRLESKLWLVGSRLMWCTGQD